VRHETRAHMDTTARSGPRRQGPPTPSWHARVLWPVVGALGILAAPGCRSVVPVAAPATYIPRERPHLLMVTKADHSVVVMHDPVLAGDTVVGLVNAHETAIPLSQVVDVKAIIKEPGQTDELVIGAIGIVAASALVAAMLTGSAPKDQGQTCPASGC